jgi:4-amino-4-deoxy-L-arabinose transferase-like glycosyltransferase
MDLNMEEKIVFKIRNLIWHLLPPILFVLIMLVYFPFGEMFEMDLDEGINLIKALLVAHDYALYSDIWSDQPPLFTYLLAGIYQIFGNNVFINRVFVLILSAMLMWAFVQILRKVWGNVHAVVGVVLLLLLPNYAKLSVSVMVGLPSLALAMLSMLALITWHQDRRTFLLILSALVLGLSVLTKLFTGFLAPIFIFGIFAAEYTRSRKEPNWQGILRPVAIWASIFTITTAGIGLLIVGPDIISELIQPHIAARGLILVTQIKTFTINEYLLKAWTILFLAFIGALFTLKSRRWLSLYPIAWLVTAYLLLSQYSPVWSHQQLLVTLPATMLAAIAAGESLRMIPQFFHPRLLLSVNGILFVAGIIGLVLVISINTPILSAELKPSPSLPTSSLRETSAENRYLRRLKNRASETNWIVTDLPMYAYRMDILVPPELAVFTWKRIETGNLTYEQVQETIDEYQPEQVLMGRFMFPELEEYLDEHYRLLDIPTDAKLYIRK